MQTVEKNHLWIISDLAYKIDAEQLAKTLRIRPGSKNLAELEALIQEAQPLADPKACYREAVIEERGQDWLRIGGQRFDSRVLQVNLMDTRRTFVFAATCGLELANWADNITDMIWHYWAECIMEQAVYWSSIQLHDHLTEKYQLGHLSTMSPGSLENWPITQQVPLFTLLGDTHAAVGVQLKDSLLMYPTKSISGMQFEMSADFASCQLCQRVNCPGRRAPYEETLYEKKYCPTA
jgi:hypothetical protein